MNEPLAPIPTPSALLWRQLRLQYLPVVVFVAGLAVAATLWTKWVAPPTLVGEAESVRVELRSSQAGTLAELNVDFLQPVKAGQIIGRVHVNDPKILDASLAVIRAEIDVLHKTTDMNFERLRLDWMSKRVELVVLRSRSQQAEATLARVAALHRIKLATDEEFDQARYIREGAVAQMEAQEELIKRLEPDLQPLSISETRTIPTAAMEGLRAAIKQKEEQLRLIEAQLSPLPLVAPMDGVITLLYRRSGETVTGGEPILQISATKSERIIGFLRQPVSTLPKTGATVEVRTRTALRQTGTATIAQVGQQFEPISPTLLTAMRLPISTVPTEFGLRVLVTAPAGLALRPGEQVDLIVRD